MAIDWKGLRGDFERGEAGFETLAAGYGCKAQTIRRRAAREGWVGSGQGAARAELKREGITGEHRLLWSTVKTRLRAGLERSDIDELKIAKMAGDGLLNIMKGETQAWGLTEDDVKTDCQEVLGITREMAELTVSPRAEEALDRDQEV
ncbi:hypothetical protein MNBD_DELTA02-738 [hydrothermal vent metagenome]|uniref:Phage terminase, small subunit n=1 Tax=hydrothermal vent metagenome TaxID=652676 RepID=A0A3B0VZV2_9ZZZZ